MARHKWSPNGSERRVCVRRLVPLVLVSMLLAGCTPAQSKPEPESHRLATVRITEPPVMTAGGEEPAGAYGLSYVGVTVPSRFDLILHDLYRTWYVVTGVLD